MKQKVALFDFDNTVASGDTIYRLLRYDLQRHPLHIFYMLKVLWFGILYILHVISFERCKSALLFPLDHMDDLELEKFYKEHVEIYYYPHIVAEMKQKKDAGYIVILCTASSEAYMKYNQLPIDKLIGTRTQRINHHASSLIVGKNCKGEEKVDRILDYLHHQEWEIDYDQSYGYSDSTSDLPMLSLVKHKKRIMLKTGEMKDFDEIKN